MEQNNIKIVISGVEGVNKGAELMLYAILQELEKKYPQAIVYLPISQFPNGLKCINTSLQLEQSPNKLVRFLGKNHITGLLNRIGLRFKYLNNLLPIKEAKYYIDASGLYFSDQMISEDRIASDLHILLKGYYEQGTKIVYLPQAFGPFHKSASIKTVEVALRYANIVIARDDKSLNYLQQLKGKSDRIKQYYDFTGVVKGVCPDEFSYLRGRVCIILNKQMIRKGALTKDSYINKVKAMIDVIYQEGYEAFFLDHADDIDLIRETLACIRYDIPIVAGLDAITVKGVIGQSYLCVSSRFHGVISAFSSGVPCLTTSWNHKYQELLKLYDMQDSMLPESIADCANKIRHFLLKDKNDNIRFRLCEINKRVQQNIIEMWNDVWSIE